MTQRQAARLRALNKHWLWQERVYDLQPRRKQHLFKYSERALIELVFWLSVLVVAAVWH